MSRKAWESDEGTTPFRRSDGILVFAHPPAVHLRRGLHRQPNGGDRSVLQMLRVAWGVRRRTPDVKTALAYGALTMIGKWANVIGQRQYRRDRAAGRNTRLIEYKSPCPTPITRPT